MKYSVITKNDLETEKVGKELVELVHAGDLICLYGNLGAGKTTFVKGFAKALGITSRIISPTFVIIREHTVPKNKKLIDKLYHLDLYRLEKDSELLGIDLKGLLQETSAVVLIEWPEIAKSIVPIHRWDVTIVLREDDTREITIEQYE